MLSHRCHLTETDPAMTPTATPRRQAPAPAGPAPATPPRLARLAALGSGAAFAAFPLLRPWGDRSGTDRALAEALAAPAWVASHAAGMLAWVALAAALILGRGGTRAGRLAAVTAALGTAAVLPYYGAETFGLAGVARTALDEGDLRLVAPAAHAIRGDAVAMTGFALGLALLAAAGVALAVAARGASPRHRGAAVAVAAGLLTYLPQFVTPGAVRQGHGLALGAALALFALTWAKRPAGPPADAAEER